MTSSMLCALLMDLSAGYASVAIAARLYRSAGCSRIALASAANWLILTHSVVLGCGLVGHLTPWTVAATIITVAAAAGLLCRRCAEPARRAFDLQRAPESSALSPLPRYLAGGAVMTLLLYWCYKSAWLPIEGLSADDRAYHAVGPTLWLQSQSIVTSTKFNCEAYYPQSAGVIALWHWLPWGLESVGAMASMPVACLPYLVLTLCGFEAICRQTGGRNHGWTLPALLFLSANTVQLGAARYLTDANIGMAAAVFASAVFCIPRSHDSISRGRMWTDAAYSALLAGLALGIKPTAWHSALVIFAFCLVRATRCTGWRTAPWVAFIWIAAGLLTGGFWYVRNFIETGNPVFPARIAGLPGLTNFPNTRLTEFAARHGLLRTVSEVATVYLQPPIHGLAMVLGFASLIGVAMYYRRSVSHAFVFWMALAITIGAVFLIAFPTQPFSGGWTYWPAPKSCTNCYESTGW